MRKYQFLGLVILMLLGIAHNAVMIYYQADRSAQEDEALSEQLQNLSQAVKDVGEQKKAYEQKIQRMSRYIVKREEQYQQRTDELLRLIEETERENNIELQNLREEIKQDDLSSVVESVQEAAVSLSTNSSRGSGVVVAPDTVVTNYHLVRGASTVTVRTNDGRNHTLQVGTTAPDRDLALLRGDLDVAPITLGNMSDVVTGQAVIAIGNPEGFGFTVTEGIISARERSFPEGTYIQTDVPINSGSSGGPLINSDGELVGINTFKIRDSESLGFAIPVSAVKSLLNGTTVR